MPPDGTVNIAQSPEMWVVPKTYAADGENGLHAHPNGNSTPSFLPILRVSSHRDNFVDLGMFVVAECGHRRRCGRLQLVEQFDREAGEVFDEICSSE
jgi:hypothetical protein